MAGAADRPAGFGPELFGPIGAGEVEAFAAASGDRNPIHLDQEAARRVGLDGPSLHGMQLVALMHEAARRALPGQAIESLSTRFLAPVPVGSTVAVSGRVVRPARGGEGAVLRLFLHRPDGMLASLGEARLAAAPAAAGP